MSFYRTVKEVVGARMKKFILPVALSCVDSILHMGMFCVMLSTILGVNPKFCVNPFWGANRAKFIRGGSRLVRRPPYQQNNA